MSHGNRPRPESHAEPDVFFSCDFGGGFLREPYFTLIPLYHHPCRVGVGFVMFGYIKMKAPELPSLPETEAEYKYK